MMAEISGAQALMYKGGLFKPAPLYQLNGALFVAWRGGYARLYASGATSVDKLMFKIIHTDLPLRADKLGRLRTDGRGQPFTPPTTYDSDA